MASGQLLVEAVDLGEEPVATGTLLEVGDLEVGLVHVVEEGEEPVVIALADRVVLVVVALRTADGEAEQDGTRRVDPVHDRLDAELLDVDPAFLVDRRIPVEAGRNELGGRWRGSRSPAIWSVTKRSYGRSLLIASMTQSRYFQIVRGASMLYPLESA